MRNRADGDVEMVAQGEVARLGELREWLQHGPAMARVRSVIEQNTNATELTRPFAVV